MLGRQVVAEGRRRGFATLGLSHGQGDVTDGAAAAAWMEHFRPALVVNCAAFTRVDDCEEREDYALDVNGRAVGPLAEAAQGCGAKLVQISTDYVFDGTKDGAYGEDDPTAPISAYGRSKLEGEHRALAVANSLVLRVSWLFGPGGGNFAATMARLIGEGRRELRVVDDQLGAPTYTPFVARAIFDLAAADATGVVHYQNRPPVSWYGFTREIARLLDPEVQVVPVATEEFPRPAPRPANSVLDVSKAEALLGRRVEPWSFGLAELFAAPRAPGHLAH